MWLFKSLFISPFLLIQVILLIIKGDSWSYGVTFIPLYVLFTILLVIVISYLYKSVIDSRVKDDKKIYFTFSLLGVICLIIFISLLTASLEYKDWPSGIFMIPVWVLLFLILVYVAATFKKWIIVESVFYLGAWALATVFSILLVLKLGGYTYDWGWTFFTVYAWFILWAIWIVYRFIKKKPNKTETVELSLEVVILAAFISFFVLLTVYLDKVGHSISKVSLYLPLLICFSVTWVVPYLYWLYNKSKFNDKKDYKKAPKEKEKEIKPEIITAEKGGGEESDSGSSFAGSDSD